MAIEIVNPVRAFDISIATICGAVHDVRLAVGTFKSFWASTELSLMFINEANSFIKTEIGIAFQVFRARFGFIANFS